MVRKKEYRRSLKFPDTEDKIDLAFYRPLGFVCAKTAQTLGLTPAQLTLSGMVFGVAAGFLFAQPNFLNLVLASILFLFSGVLDSADGQLARISGKSTPFGLVLDGLCDNLVFISVYIGCTLPLTETHGNSIWILAGFAGISHSFQSATLDFYLREYLYFTETKNREMYRNPSVDDAYGALRRAENLRERFFWRLRYSWIFQQRIFSVRSPKVQDAFDAASNPELYRHYNKRLLHFWRPLGANVHTAGILFFAAIGRFDLYLLFVDILGLNLLLLLASYLQRRSDRQLLFAMEYDVRHTH